MAASKPKTFRLSHALADAIELRAKQRGYPSATALIEALARYDCLCQSTHGVTTKWAKLPEVDQDELDAKLLGRVLRGEGMNAKEAANADWRML